MVKLIAVFGATGTQGGSVARALLNDPKSFKVRAVTRNPNGEKAQQLADLGAEVVNASLDDPSTLLDALSGCYGVFGVTIYDDHRDKNREVKQGKALVDACIESGIQHLIFSLFQSTTDQNPLIAGKAEIEKYMLESEIRCTSVRYSFYMENLLAGPLKPKLQHDGSFALAIPIDTPFGLLAASEAGKAVSSIFRCPDRYYGRIIPFAGDKITVKRMANILSRHLAPKVFRPSKTDLEQFSRLGFPGADELAGLFDFYQSGNYELNLALTRHLDPGTKTFEEWVVANKSMLNEVFNDED
ncbi:nmrA-like family domain-containing protein 1 [Amphiura filiformis]|uniref:nmrA-like family domain-containing protein 1 n=1 Tax=Amphiura filiformis TaxID=82378 RepID=UPI003B21D658